MVRPRRLRMVEGMPSVVYYKPQGIPLRCLKEVVVSVSEFEALRLKDYEGLGQIDASVRMDISQPTFNRLYMDARRKIGRALVEGLAIRIEGGNYKMPNRDGTGPEGKGPRTGRGLGPCAEKEGEQDAPLRGRPGLGQGRRPRLRRERGYN
jgi:uncharacterized protein